MEETKKEVTQITIENDNTASSTEPMKQETTTVQAQTQVISIE